MARSCCLLTCNESQRQPSPRDTMGHMALLRCLSQAANGFFSLADFAAVACNFLHNLQNLQLHLLQTPTLPSAYGGYRNFICRPAL
eukprot:1114711-Pleurochrysis_carterae.AAC.3